MRQSLLFAKTQRNLPKDEISQSAQYLLRAAFIDKVMAGVFTLLPLGLRVFKKVEQIIREEMDAVGGQEIFMPTLQPRENWEQTGRWSGLDVLFRLPTSDNREVALGPTHEEIVSPLLKKYIFSYRDLPVAVYHIQNKFRNEKRAKSGLLRGREFIMKDLYSFHTDQADLDRYYELVKGAYHKIFSRCGLGEITYLTFASGGSFSKYSHEFQALSEAGEDTIYLCPRCRIAVNKEIIGDLDRRCPECGSSDLSAEKKAIEVGNIFKLGTKYSAPFDLGYLDREGRRQTAVMGCYGIGLQRLLATVVEASHDEKGMIWPELIAPYRAHLVSLNSENEAVRRAADELYERLKAEGTEVLYDDRREISAGEKLNDADLIGLPWRLVMSEKSLAAAGVEIKSRISSAAAVVNIAEALARLKPVDPPPARSPELPE